MRGQTTLDFATGTVIFLLSLIFVFSFVPGILQPFIGTQQAEPVVANRAADRLVEGGLGSPDRPYALNQTCTVEFFNDNAPSGCNYQGTDLNDRVGLTDRTNLNITMSANVTGGPAQEQVCWDRDAGVLKEIGLTDCDVDMAVGSGRPETSSSITAQRVAYLNGTAVTVEVTTW
jgi:hypothetical protein